jgi:hypothetical protein
MVVPVVTFANHGTLVVETEANTLANKWRNSIDVVWDPIAGPPGPGEGVITAFLDFLVGIQRDDCTLTHALLRPWSRGNVPFSEQGSLWEESLSLPCSNFGSGSAHPSVTVPLTPTVGEVCLLMTKNVFAGRGKAGRLFLHNSVGQETMSAAAGAPPFLNPSFAAAFTSEVNAWADAKLGTYCTTNPLPRYCLVHYSVSNPPPFDTPITVPHLTRLTMHDVGKE